MIPDIAFIGALRSGKTTTAHALAEELTRNGRTVRLMSFADGVREEIATALTHLDGGVETMFVAGFDQAVAKLTAEMRDPLTKAKWRPILQCWGTEVRRKIYGDDYWVKRLQAKINGTYKADPILIDDCRFPNEATMLHDNGFKIIRLAPNPIEEVHPHFPPAHESEAYWRTLPADLEVPWTPVEYRVAKILNYIEETLA